jgi:sulfur-oxidizing protein SoxA
MTAPNRSHRSAGMILGAILSLIGAAGLSANEPTPLVSATRFLSDELRAEQQDEARNRGMLWVDQGAELWRRAPSASEQSCAACHGDARTSMAGVSARYPAVDTSTGRLLNIEGRINACRERHQKSAPLAYESNELLALTAFLALQSRGRSVAVATEAPAAAAALELGRRFWSERQGQLNLACTHCHDDNVGRRLRGDTISSGLPTGYPAYRLEWQGLGSLYRRLRACQIGVRAEPFPAGSDIHLALELFLADRARGATIEAPAIRR